MSQPITQPVTPADVSVWSRVTTAVSDSVNWCGRSVALIGRTIANYAVKAWLAVRPILVAIGRFFSEKIEMLKDFFKEHKQVTLYSLAAAGACVAAYFAWNYLYCTETASSDETIAIERKS